MLEFVFFDIDTMRSRLTGIMRGEGFNYHYQAHGYHPILCYDGLTGDTLRVQLRNGTDYCLKDSAEFMESLIDEYRKDYPDI